MKLCHFAGARRDPFLLLCVLLIAVCAADASRASYSRANRKGERPPTAATSKARRTGVRESSRSRAATYSAGYQSSGTVCQCLRFHRYTTCPSGFVRCNGKCLKFHSMQANWLEAKQYCEATRSKLLSIENSYEQSCIMGYIHRHKDTFPGSFWTGGNNLADQYQWRWVANNAPIRRFRWWQEGNPDDGGRGSEHCMELERNYFYRWNDQPCDMRNHFICQIELNRLHSTPP